MSHGHDNCTISSSALGRNSHGKASVDRRVRDPVFHDIPVLLPGTERPRRGDVAHLEFLINGVGGVVFWDMAVRKRLAEDPLPVKETSYGGSSPATRFSRG